MPALTQTLSVTKAQVARSLWLHEQLRAVLAHSAALRARARALCRFRRIAGGSDLDTPLIIDAIRQTPMCVECLVRRTGAPPMEVTQALKRIGEHVALATFMASCGGCLRLTRLHGLKDGARDGAPRPPDVPRRTTPTQTDAVWQVLESRRGSMWCTQCIATALAATRRIDRAILGAEGRGARRHYGACDGCGKDRLLCGLAH